MRFVHRYFKFFIIVNISIIILLLLTPVFVASITLGETILVSIGQEASSNRDRMRNMSVVGKGC